MDASFFKRRRRWSSNRRTHSRYAGATRNYFFSATFQRSLLAKRDPNRTLQLNPCDSLPKRSFVQKSYSFSRPGVPAIINLIANFARDPEALTTRCKWHSHCLSVSPEYAATKARDFIVCERSRAFSEDKINIRSIGSCLRGRSRLSRWAINGALKTHDRVLATKKYEHSG